MREVVQALSGSAVQVGIHCHDDAGCGVANTLAAVQQGATHVQGTINGYGERCGNANLVSVIPNLQLKLGYQCLSDEQLASLTAAAHFLDELLNFTPDPDQPYVGRNAFAHKGGMHVAGVSIDPATFEHLDPAVVGNHREVLISELSGKGTVHARARDAGISLDDAAAARGSASASRSSSTRATTTRRPTVRSSSCCARRPATTSRLFTLEHWRVIVEMGHRGHVETEATIKLWVGGERYVRTAEGNGPVNALDRALRDAIGEIYPHLADIELENFKVRLIDTHAGSASITRVLIDGTDGDHVWGSIGVSENIIEASWEALVDSLEYGMRLSRVRRGPS